MGANMVTNMGAAQGKRQGERLAMTDLIHTMMRRRTFVAGSIAGLGTIALPACSTGRQGFSLVEVLRRLLTLASERAFGRLTSDGGFWDESVARVGLNSFLGNRGGVLSNVLTSTLFKKRLEGAIAGIAEDASFRAAPLVADAVRIMGPANALDLVRGGPNAATSFLRQEMGTRLLDALIPGVGDALRVADEPLIGELLAGLTGVDVSGVARGFSGKVDDAIWREIGIEEAAIRADPAATGDPLLIGALGVGAAL